MIKIREIKNITHRWGFTNLLNFNAMKLKCFTVINRNLKLWSREHLTFWEWYNLLGTAHFVIQILQVIGIPEARLGEEVCAWIKLKDGQHATAEEIKQFCKGQVSWIWILFYTTFLIQHVVQLLRFYSTKY